MSHGAHDILPPQPPVKRDGFRETCEVGCRTSSEASTARNYGRFFCLFHGFNAKAQRGGAAAKRLRMCPLNTRKTRKMAFCGCTTNFAQIANFSQIALQRCKDAKARLEFSAPLRPCAKASALMVRVRSSQNNGPFPSRSQLR